MVKNSDSFLSEQGGNHMNFVNKQNEKIISWHAHFFETSEY